MISLGKNGLVIITALLLTACATPSAKEIMQKTDVGLINSENCVSSLSELKAEQFCFTRVC